MTESNGNSSDVEVLATLAKAKRVDELTLEFKNKRQHLIAQQNVKGMLQSGQTLKPLIRLVLDLSRGTLLAEYESKRDALRHARQLDANTIREIGDKALTTWGKRHTGTGLAKGLVSPSYMQFAKNEPQFSAVGKELGTGIERIKTCLSVSGLQMPRLLKASRWLLNVAV